ncbi:MAG: LPS export ABC transporter periplasmic protein LptC [Tabrizicola sp.]|nr:LPS export ABC transporter periplasmic protein LptC [Tabrizicola sp.]
MARLDTHSRLVAWLKVALPLTALAILSTLFLLADRIDPEAALPYADVDVEDRLREPRMTAPTYAGTTDDGGAISVVAASARPSSDQSAASASEVLARMDTPDGSETVMLAAAAEIDNVARLLRLSGGVVITTSAGYRIETDGLSASLDRSGLESDGAVIATGPPGRIVADKMTLSQDNQTPGAYLLVFKGNVKLVYQPGG